MGCDLRPGFLHTVTQRPGFPGALEAAEGIAKSCEEVTKRKVQPSYAQIHCSCHRTLGNCAGCRLGPQAVNSSCYALPPNVQIRLKVSIIMLKEAEKYLNF